MCGYPKRKIEGRDKVRVRRNQITGKDEETSFNTFQELKEEVKY